MADHVLHVLKRHTVSLLATAWRDRSAHFGSFEDIAKVVDPGYNAPAGTEPRVNRKRPGIEEVALLISASMPPDGDVLWLQKQQQAAQNLAGHIDHTQRLRSNNGTVGSVVVVPVGVVTWAEIRAHLLEPSMDGVPVESAAVDSGDLPVHVDFIAVPAGKFSRLLFFTMLRLQGVMGLPLF
jgi:hypothetical protein